MGRMYTGRKGKSHSTRPISKTAPSWCKASPEEVKDLIIKLAKEGNPPSKIGIILRDMYGIPLAKLIVGKKITQILKEAGLSMPIPEDLSNLLKKAERLKKHLAIHRKDLHNLRSLQLIEAKIYRLSEYYKREGILPENWKYEPFKRQ